ncbi:hypothetical protein [uncultured Algimonas sp.]|uniref:hypothetical protein n=1 Tax=uncultured Algimonas sp. TaxID=1547920 RepID=UPI002631E336|nr:hypothetical protein [uncultured Algimonas sp.]
MGGTLLDDDVVHLDPLTATYAVMEARDGPARVDAGRAWGGSAGGGGLNRR